MQVIFAFTLCLVNNFVSFLSRLPIDFLTGLSLVFDQLIELELFLFNLLVTCHMISGKEFLVLVI